MRILKRLLLWSGMAVGVLLVVAATLIVWPTPLFAYSAASGRIVVASDRPIPPAGAARVLQDCERLLARSPLAAEGRRYRLYVTNADWRHRLFFLRHQDAGGLAYFYGFGGTVFLAGADFDAGRLIKWGYVTTPPRTLAYFCAHEITHLVTGEHLGIWASETQPQWVHEGFADYVAIESRESFEGLRAALGDRPVDVPMMQRYGAYPRFRLLVTYFLEKRGWSADALLRTRLSFEAALAMMRADAP